MTEFYGFERQDGSVGLRNHLLVIAPIDCSFEPAKRIAAQVEGAVAVTQYYGCGINEMVLNNLVGTGCNPNVAGVLLVGLGCETLTSELIAERIASTGKPLDIVICQRDGGTLKTIEDGVRKLRKIAQEASEAKREPFPLNKLILAVECGGSDATSGLAANPAVGVASDLLIEEGGTVIISEPQEMTGTEHILAQRAINENVSKKIYEMISRQEQRMKAMGVDSRFMSKGNIDGGLTTIEEKSLGAIRKGGTKPIQGVLENNRKAFDKPTCNGLWIQDGTGWDVASVTHMVAAGAQIVAFTTGRGSTVGHAIAPVLKITGNPETYARMEDNMDINAGTILDGSESLNSVGERIFNALVETASGKMTKAEALGYKDFAIFSTDRISERMLGFCD
ncbi:UxaA family hydrolase [Candidatus Bathyarchaeota archaeon]|nr:UxaA family hydrolase [Candidatus Bathyarchaeota archaeon]MBS7630473.1 UxaA family hydrolase [Candidatus Bathyarchaeota archaeon]